MAAESHIGDNDVLVASVSVASYIDSESGDLHYCAETVGDASLSTFLGLLQFGILELWEATREERLL
jgi:hypothetical protein